MDDFVSRMEVLSYDDTAASHYGVIRADLEKKGAPTGLHDLHIAGHARSRSLVLVTNNTGEFRHVEGLRIEGWSLEKSSNK